MRRSPFPVAVVLAAAVLAGAGCEDPPETPSPTEPTPTVTESFSGTLSPNGAVSFPFLTGAAGQVTATLTSVGPDATVPLGLSLGTWNGTSCAVVIANDNAVQGTVLFGNVSGIGNLCVRLYDVGRLVAPATFEVQVIHP